MIETYAFLAMFAVQILGLAVLHMVVLVKYFRALVAELPDEYFAPLTAEAGREAGTKWLATRYRAVQAVIAVVGILLLGWLFSYTGRPHWDADRLTMLSVVYFFLTFLPMPVYSVYALAFQGKASQHPPLEKKRTAVLQRRRLFDFVSPFAVSLAVAGYLLFVAFALYLRSKPVYIGLLTFVYGVTAVYMYWELYGYARKLAPDEPFDSHIHAIGVGLRNSVYTLIATVVFFSFTATVGMQDADRWVPFGIAGLFVINTLFACIWLDALTRKSEIAEFGASSVR